MSEFVARSTVPWTRFAEDSDHRRVSAKLRFAETLDVIGEAVMMGLEARRIETTDRNGGPVHVITMTRDGVVRSLIEIYPKV